MQIWDWAAVILSFLVIAWFVRIVWAKNRDDDRLAEDAARAHFDRTGRWPDEDGA
jgi:hypothetical protein